MRDEIVIKIYFVGVVLGIESDMKLWRSNIAQ